MSPVGAFCIAKGTGAVTSLFAATSARLQACVLFGASERWTTRMGQVNATFRHPNLLTSMQSRDRLTIVNLS